MFQLLLYWNGVIDAGKRSMTYWNQPTKVLESMGTNMVSGRVQRNAVLQEQHKSGTMHTAPVSGRQVVAAIASLT